MILVFFVEGPCKFHVLFDNCLKKKMKKIPYTGILGKIHFFIVEEKNLRSRYAHMDEVRNLRRNKYGHL